MLNQKGAIQFVVIAILLVGIVALLFLVQNRTNLFPKAAVSTPISGDYCQQFIVSEVCGQPSYDHCNISCDEQGQAFYNCFPSDPEAAQVCSGAIYCEAENYLCMGENIVCPPGTTATTNSGGETVCIGNSMSPEPTAIPNTNTVNPYQFFGQ